MGSEWTIEKRKLEDSDRSFDIEFWQAQPAEARYAAAWEMAVHYWKVRGVDVRKLPFHRTIAKVKFPHG
jgi:hypothetical protein